MSRLLWDENTSQHILRALRLQRPDVDVVTVQHLGLTGADDEVVLDRALAENRILLTQDRTTIPAAVYARMQIGRPKPRVLVLRIEAVPIPKLVGDILEVLDAAEPADWELPIFIPYSTSSVKPRP